jgi:methionyl-tRNA formyltransferase
MVTAFAPGASALDNDAALRILFFGTPEFALVTLDALLRSRHQVVGVVTQPDRPRGRGQRVSESPVKQRAVRAGLPVLQPERLREAAFLEAAAALGADLGVVAAYGKILTDQVLALPRLGLLNVHGSVLPRYRGAAPVHRAIIAGDTETGVTIMRVVKALDAGPTFAVARRPIGPHETSEQVERDLARLGADLLVATIDELTAGRARETPQDEAAATDAPRLTKADGIVDWTWSADRLHNLIRGLYPWPHAFAFLHDRRVILHRSAVASVSHSAPPGTVLEAHGDRLLVATGGGTLDLVDVQPEGKRKMGVREFLAGHAVAVGDRFAAPVPRE